MDYPFIFRKYIINCNIKYKYTHYSTIAILFPGLWQILLLILEPLLHKIYHMLHLKQAGGRNMEKKYWIIGIMILS